MNTGCLFASYLFPKFRYRIKDSLFFLAFKIAKTQPYLFGVIFQLEGFQSSDGSLKGYKL